MAKVHIDKISGEAIKHEHVAGDISDGDTTYLKKAGLSGGQTAYGGTDASDNLTLHSTSHATKGTINLKDNTGLTSGKKFYFDT